jgi:hypothetical protein
MRAILRIPMSVIEEFSPDALAIMRFESQDEVETVAKPYALWPKFGDASAGDPYRSYMRELDMGNDRERFSEDPAGLPLYEGRMVWQYDHRAKGYRSGRGRAAVWEPLPFGREGKSIQPQWRVSPNQVPAKAGERVTRFRIGFCDVASATNERSLVACLLPPGVICGDKVPTILFPQGFEWAYMVWLAVANSFCMDFVVRKKVALKMALSLMDSLPFPRMTAASHPIARALVPRAAEITCTSEEMLDFWSTLADGGWVEPLRPGQAWGATTDARRAELKAQIDAIVAAQVFELERNEFEFVLDSFGTAAKYEEAAFGEFRSRRLALEAYDALIG